MRGEGEVLVEQQAAGGEDPDDVRDARIAAAVTGFVEDRAEEGEETPLRLPIEAGSTQNEELVGVEQRAQLLGLCFRDAARRIDAADLDGELRSQRPGLHGVLLACDRKPSG